jgi:hypothetical protein
MLAPTTDPVIKIASIGPVLEYGLKYLDPKCPDINTILTITVLPIIIIIYF